LRDFIISFGSADLAWAKWVASCLEEAGYSILLQCFDAQNGSTSTSLPISKAQQEARRIILILSPHFPGHYYAQLREIIDPQNAPEKGRSIFISIHVEVGGPENPSHVSLDLVGLSKSDAKEKLLTFVAELGTIPHESTIPHAENTSSNSETSYEFESAPSISASPTIYTPQPPNRPQPQVLVHVHDRMPALTTRTSLFVIVAILVVLGSVGIYYIAKSIPFIPYSFAGSTSSSVPAARQQVYRTSAVNFSGITSIDPAQTITGGDDASFRITNMLFTGLAQLGDDLKVYPQLAQTWDESPDHLRWTFHLKPNLKFSDGTQLTSADIVYSINRALQPATQSTTAPFYLSYIKDASELSSGKIITLIGDSLMNPDPNTVVIIASKPIPYFLDMLTYPTSFVVEKSLIDKYGQQFAMHLNEGGGAGPFKVSRYIDKQEIDLTPNSNYYDHQPRLQKVIFSFYADNKAAYQAYQANQIDATSLNFRPSIAKTPSLPIAGFDQAKLFSKDAHRVPQLQIYYFGMNYLIKPFDNIKIRQAFALSLNKQLLAHAIFKDVVIPTNHLVPQGIASYNNPNLTGPAGVTSLSGDPDKARQLFQEGLKEAGYASRSQLPHLTLTYASGSADVDNLVAASIQMWQIVLGVKVTPKVLDFNQLLTLIVATINNPRGLQMWNLGYVADYPDTQDWLTFQFDKNSGNNFNNFENYGQNNSSDAQDQQALQSKLEQADFNQDQVARMKIYNDTEQQLVNDVARIPLYQSSTIYLYKPYVIGEKFNAIDQTPPNDWANIYIAA
jgi:oligopeptide transport system substrate-binding protein